MKLADRLQKARIAAHLDQFIVAHQIGVHYKELQLWENPEYPNKQPNITQFIALGTLYGLKWGFCGDYEDIPSVHTLPALETPQIKYDLNHDQCIYLSALHWGLPSVGQALMAVDYRELVDLELVENEQLTAHGEWYCEKVMNNEEVTS